MSNSIGGNRLLGWDFTKNERANRGRCRPPAKFVRGHQSTMSLARWGLLHCELAHLWAVKGLRYSE